MNDKRIYDPLNYGRKEMYYQQGEGNVKEENNSILVDVSTFNIEDLAGRTVKVSAAREGFLETIFAKDINNGDVFILKEIRHERRLNEEHLAILKHTQKNGFFCGESPEIKELCDFGIMLFAGRKSFVPDPYFKLGEGAQEVIDFLEKKFR